MGSIVSDQLRTTNIFSDHHCYKQEFDAWCDRVILHLRIKRQKEIDLSSDPLSLRDLHSSRNGTGSIIILAIGRSHRCLLSKVIALVTILAVRKCASSSVQPDYSYSNQIIKVSHFFFFYARPRPAPPRRA